MRIRKNMPPHTSDSTETPAVDKAPPQIRRMFGAIAGRYDFLNHFLSLGIDRSWRKKTVRAVPPVGEGPVLDVCAGTGDLTLGYARACNSGILVVGTDFCHEMLEIARRKCERRPEGANVKLVESDACRLPFDDDIFQIVCVAFGLRNVGDTDKGLSEMVRVCRRGGRVAVLEFSMPRRGLSRRLYAWYFRTILPSIGQLLTRSPQKAYHYLPESVLSFPQGEAMVQRMCEAGLRDVLMKPFTWGICTLYVGIK